MKPLMPLYIVADVADPKSEESSYIREFIRSEQIRWIKLVDSFCDKFQGGEWIGFEMRGQFRLRQKPQSEQTNPRAISLGKIAGAFSLSELISILLWLQSKLPTDSPIQDRIRNTFATTSTKKSILIEIIHDGLLSIGHIFLMDQ